MGLYIDGESSARYLPAIVPAAVPTAPLVPAAPGNSSPTVTIGKDCNRSLFEVFLYHGNQLLSVDERTKLSYEERFLLVFKRLSEYNKSKNFDMKLVDSRLPGAPNPLDIATVRDPNMVKPGEIINLTAPAGTPGAAEPATAGPVVPPLTAVQIADVNKILQPAAPTLPTLADVASRTIDGQTLPQASMAALVAQYSNADHGSDQYKWAMAVKAQSVAQTGLPVNPKDFKAASMSSPVVTHGVIDLPKVQSILSAFSQNKTFTDKLGTDYQAINDGLTLKYFPTAISTTQKPLLWAAVNGDPVPKPQTPSPVVATPVPIPTPSPSAVTGSPAPAPTASPSISPSSPVAVSITPASPDTLKRGNLGLQSLRLNGLSNGEINPQALAATPQNYLSGGVLNLTLLTAVPAAETVIAHPDLVNESLAVVANIQAGAANVAAKPFGGAGTVAYGVNAQLAYLAKTHPGLTPQQRSDAVNQAYELMGVSNRQATEYAKAVAPYLRAPPSPAAVNPGVPTASPGPAPVAPGTLPQGVTLSADAPASAKAAWDALHKVAEMRAALDDTGAHPPSALTTEPALTKNLDRTSLETAIYQGANTQFSSSNVANGWADYIATPAYAKWLATLPSAVQKSQINGVLATIRAFNPKIADAAAEKLGLNLFQQTFDGNLSTVDPKAGAAVAYFVLNVARWSARTVGFLGGTSDKEMRQFAEYLFTAMQRIQARGGDPAKYTEFLAESRKDGSKAKMLLPMAEKLNLAGLWGSIAGAVDLTAAGWRGFDPEFQAHLFNGTDPFNLFDNSQAAWDKRDAIVNMANYADIFGSYAEHYVRLGYALGGKSAEATNKIALYRPFGEIMPELKESLRPDVNTLSKALNNVNPEDTNAVQAALDDAFSKNGQLKKFLPGIKYDTKSFAERYTKAAKLLSPDELAAVKSNPLARLGFLLDSPVTGVAGGARTPLAQEISKQAKALTGVDLSNRDAVAHALIDKGKYPEGDAKLLSNRIATSAATNGGGTATTLETYGRLTVDTYSNAPRYSDLAIQASAMEAGKAGGNVALAGVIDVSTEKIGSGLTRGLGYTGLALKGGVAALDVLSGPLSIYSGVHDIYDGLNRVDAYGNPLPNNYGMVGFGAVEVEGGVFWGAAGLAEIGMIDMAAGPFFLVAMGLTVIGGVGVLISQKIVEPSKTDQNKQTLEGFFKPYNEAGLTSPDWKNNVDNWSRTEQTATVILAPGQFQSHSLLG